MVAWFSKSFQTVLGISGLSSIFPVTSSNRSYQLLFCEVFRMEFLTILFTVSPFFIKTVTENVTEESLSARIVTGETPKRQSLTILEGKMVDACL